MKIIFLFCFLFLSIRPSQGITSLHAQTAVRFDPLPQFLPFSSLDNFSTVEQEIDAFLLLSNTPPENLAGYKARIETWLKELSTYLVNATPEKTVGEHILLFLFDHQILKKYYYKATRLDDIMNGGVYNCVSSAVLYAIFARSVGIDVSGVLTPDHAFVTVTSANGKQIDIETTNRYGFSPGTKKEFTDHFSNATGFAYVPPGNYSDRKTITAKELFGLILQNRIAEASYFEAVGLGSDYALFEPNSSRVEGFRDQAFLNLLAEYNQTKRYEEGMNSFFILKEKYPDAALEESFEILVSNQIGTLLNANKIEAASLLLEKKEVQTYLSQNRNKELHQSIALKKIYQAVQDPKLDPQTGFSLLDRGKKEGVLSQKEYENFTINLISLEVNRLMKQGVYADAFDFIQGLAPSQKNLPQYRQIQKNVENNLAISYHNQFVVAYNSQAFSQAESILSQGLKILPGNTVLNRDKEQLDRYLNQ